MIAIFIAVLLAQQTSPPAAAARVAGRVADSLTGDGVPKAAVILRAHDPEHAWSYGDETDAQGYFSISAIEPGEYNIAVERAGFTLESAGAAGAPGPTVKINAGQSRNDLNLGVAPLGVIAGQIVDSEGEPARGAIVDALHYVYVSGKKQLRSVATARSGDRGAFRLFGLRAGIYYLKATGRQVAPFELRDNATVTYYPGTADSTRAAPIELRAGDQMRGFDIRLQSSGAHIIRFKLPPGIRLSPTESHLFNGQGFLPTEGGTSRNEVFFGNVPPALTKRFSSASKRTKAEATPGGTSKSPTRKSMAGRSILFPVRRSPVPYASKAEPFPAWRNSTSVCHRTFAISSNTT